MKEHNVSVIMPNFNHGRFLTNAVTALSEQSICPSEIVLVDDGSSDHSLTIMKALQKRFPFIRILENNENLGTTESCNRGLADASGDYILFASADDVVLPGLMETGLRWLTDYPSAAMCCFTYISYDEATGTVKEIDYLWSDYARHMCPAELAEVILGWSIQTQGTIYRRDSFEKAGGLREELKWHSDWFVNHVLAFRHGICYVPEPYTIRREHDDSYSHRGRSHWSIQSRIIRRILELFCSEEYRDILPYISLSGLMAFFDQELHRLFLSDPTLWRTENLVLAFPVLATRFRNWREKRQRVYANQKDTDLGDFVLKTFQDR
jgi:GT2 family glycosyltransferase